MNLAPSKINPTHPSVESEVNHNYIYLKTGYATERQVVQAFLETFTRYKVKTRFKVSVVKIKGSYCGYAYVWIENKDAFAKLVGLGSDGKPRFKTMLDPEWKMPSKPLEEAKQELKNTILDDSDEVDWADLAEEEDMEAALEESYQPRIITIPIEPTYKLPRYEYDEKQLERIIKDFAYVDQETIPEQGAFVVNSANIPREKLDLQQNVLFCNHVPTWITNSQLKTLFLPYASNSSTVYKRIHHKSTIRDSYPFITISSQNRSNSRGRGNKYHQGKPAKNNLVYITYDPSKIDGRMALLVCRQMQVVDPSDPSKQALLHFNHPKKTSTSSERVNHIKRPYSPARKSRHDRESSGSTF